MTPPPAVELYSDLHCPWAYAAAFRLRAVLPELAGRLEVRLRCLSLELVNERGTPRGMLEAEIPIVARLEPRAEFAGFGELAEDWPSTMLPAFEALKCAERQGTDAALRFDLEVRRAFFAGRENVALRHVLLRVAERAGLDLAAFARDWDSGALRPLVLEESRRGWHELNVPGSPTFVLPGGRMIANPGMPPIELTPRETVARVEPAPCSGDGCLDVYRRFLREAAAL
jgi:predicted DsbA family dithiol-disulfide isomerase